MKFRLGCKLAYKVVAETVFIFNVQVAFLQRHINLVDQLNFNPNLPRRFYTVPDSRNRYTQVVAPIGDRLLSYTAEVDLDIFRADPATVHEMDVRDLLLNILPYLLPSRFVPSDRLANFAMREFAAFLEVIFASVKPAIGSIRVPPRQQRRSDDRNRNPCSTRRRLSRLCAPRHCVLSRSRVSTKPANRTDYSRGRRLSVGCRLI